MKRTITVILIFALLLGVNMVAHAEKQRYTINELGITLELESEDIVTVYTRNMDPDDPYAIMNGADVNQIKQTMESENIYLYSDLFRNNMDVEDMIQAIADENIAILGAKFGVVADDTELPDLNALPEELIEKTLLPMIEAIATANGQSVLLENEVREINGQKYLYTLARESLDNTDIYSVYYITVNNGDTIGYRYEAYSEINEAEMAQIGEIISSIQYASDTAQSKKKTRSATAQESTQEESASDATNETVDLERMDISGDFVAEYQNGILYLDSGFLRVPVSEADHCVLYSDLPEDSLSFQRMNLTTDDINLLCSTKDAAIIPFDGKPDKATIVSLKVKTKDEYRKYGDFTGDLTWMQEWYMESVGQGMQADSVEFTTINGINYAIIHMPVFQQTRYATMLNGKTVYIYSKDSAEAVDHLKSVVESVRYFY